MAALMVSLCAVDAREFDVYGTIKEAQSNRPIEGVRVRLLKFKNQYFTLFPELAVACESVSDRDGVFVMHVSARRGVILEVFQPTKSTPNRHDVPVKLVKNGRIDLEVRTKNGISEVRWNDGEWVIWERAQPKESKKER